MELTYKVRGADGKEYGPASLEQITAWLREGRVTAQTEVNRSDVDYWAPATSFSELQGTPPPAARPVPASIGPTAGPASGDDPATLARMKSGASWFYWIAGLSLINSIAAFSGGSWRFLFGLGITQVIDAFGQHIESAGKLIAFGLNLVVFGVFVLFGVFAHKRQLWAFVIGMVLFGLDSAIFLLAQDWLGVGFHAFVLYCLFRGVQACREVNAA